jgi:hypothetical protein
VKINPLSNALSFLGRVRDKQDAEGGGQGGGHHAGSDQQQQKDETTTPTVEVSDDTIEKAIEAFAVDTQTLANGLSASRVGTGPGLKVVLKDSSGAVLRQFSGEEFLRLRGASNKDVRARGKILDQKL